MRRALSRSAVESEPHLVWNAFIDLIATEDYEDLSPIQRPAHLAFWYGSEVQNGGHDQYFENRGTDLIDETLEALRVLGLQCQASILGRAADRWGSRRGEALPDRETPGLSEEDASFHRCSPTVTEGLETYMKRHQGEFVLLE